MRILSGETASFRALTTGVSGGLNMDYTGFENSLLPEARSHIIDQRDYFNNVAHVEMQLDNTVANLANMGMSDNNLIYAISSTQGLLNAPQIMQEAMLTHPAVREAAAKDIYLYEDVPLPDKSGWDNELYKQIHSGRISETGLARKSLSMIDERDRLSYQEKVAYIKSHNYIDWLLENGEMDDIVEEDTIYL